MTGIELISIEPTTRCAKACWFCYNHSGPEGATEWTADEIVSFVFDCAAHGVKAVSFGGGEPLQYPEIFDVLARLRGRLFRSMTSNGLMLDDPTFARLLEAAPEKVHISIHFPERADEVGRVIEQVHRLQSAGIRSGINFVVSRRNLEPAREAAERVRASGIGNDRIVYLPMRVQDTPAPEQIGAVAGSMNFQSMSCLMGCAKSARFVSIAADKTIGWCSYTAARNKLKTLNYAGLMEALDNLGLTFCGGTDRNGG
ncbi:radical SAM protein, partial [Candidatus Sumerlaeota bacterium]|nr:radical SAM protein [Candidatus Sumerlaeota bacterium]